MGDTGQLPPSGAACGHRRTARPARLTPRRQERRLLPPAVGSARRGAAGPGRAGAGRAASRAPPDASAAGGHRAPLLPPAGAAREGLGAPLAGGSRREPRPAAQRPRRLGFGAALFFGWLVGWLVVGVLLFALVFFREEKGLLACVKGRARSPAPAVGRALPSERAALSFQALRLSEPSRDTAWLEPPQRKGFADAFSYRAPCPMMHVYDSIPAAVPAVLSI